MSFLELFNNPSYSERVWHDLELYIKIILPKVLTDDPRFNFAAPMTFELDLLVFSMVFCKPQFHNVTINKVTTKIEKTK